ncbi:segregation/condensation protein A [Oceanirhabdus seepicola]|uniref:Segregation and condensation protein A n=1 Tax=Oceanirhabdus seepicola TaxID=2828781 RepID=A0A9J6P861_9CLOT|nr:segregation/condensation protein A [Oceanirhabdus seepicola]MCM1992763.1 segregation/condensation protein A [Oceanirhabdus seepicola]
MALNIKIHNFEGPFDLLLHLIKKNKMSIYDIKIADITKQYMEYIEAMKNMDLDITSEFIVIAAMLLEMKSKELLPKNNLSDDDGENELTKEDLINKLILYRKFKVAAEYLKGKSKTFGYMFTKKPEIIVEKKEFDLEEMLKGVTLLELFNIYNETMYLYMNKRNENNGIPNEFLIDKYKIEDKMQHINLILKKSRNIQFKSIMKTCESKMEVIVTFLAMLELIKLRNIKVYQKNNFNEIHIERVVDNG